MMSILDNEILREVGGVGEAGGVSGAVSMLLELPSGSGSGTEVVLVLEEEEDAAVTVAFRLVEAVESMGLSIFEIFILAVRK